ncbi:MULTISPECIES: GumC family protein [Nostocales]|uniref:GumC family protein n=2 Tax=Nostocales TaxID=1161 RepID=A0ABW8WST0_9CYAN|nr:polysaccharide biosynthesis tyrosine autokinase [Tolypothrix bouteillei]
MTDIGLERGKIVLVSQKSTVEVKKLSKLLLRRRRQIFSVYCIVMSLTSVLAFMTKPTYQSSMQIMVSSRSSEGGRSNSLQEGVENKAVDPTFEVIDRTSQLKLMLSSRLLQKVVDSLRSDYPDLTVEDIRGNAGKQGRLSVTKVEGNTENNKLLTEIFEISYKDNDPVKAQKVLVAIQKVYQNSKIEQQKERISRWIAFLNERLPKVKKEIVQAETQLEKFRKKHNLLDPEIQGKILLESLADVRKQLRLTRAQLQDAQARYSNLKKEINSYPLQEIVSFRLSQSPRYQTLVQQIQKTDLTLAQERLRYTENSPTVQKLIQQRQNQVALLQQEMEQTLGEKTEALSDTLLKQKQLFAPESITIEAPLAMKGQRVGMDSKLVEELVEVQTTVLGLSANEKSLTESESQIQLELNKYPGLIAEYNRLLPEVETHRKILEHLMTTQQSLGLIVDRGGYELQVLEEPQRGAYLGSNRFLIVLIGALVAPILGIGTAVLSETLSDTISSPQDLQNLSHLRLLGTVPKLSLLSIEKKQFSLPSIVQRILTGSSTKAVLEEDSLLCFQSHETLDMTYQNIQLGFSSPCKSLMVTSAISGEGKSTLALGLAVSAARMHRRVLLIDANLREPNLHKMLALSNDWGLSLLLVEETNASAKQYVQPVHPSIDVLTAGPIPEDSVKLLSSTRMKELLQFFEQNYDMVLVDAPSILGTVNTRLMASYCKGVALVGRLGQVTSTELVEATEVLSNFNLIGIIANGVNSSVY